jgi:hypothetical protein
MPAQFLQPIIRRLIGRVQLPSIRNAPLPQAGSNSRMFDQAKKLCCQALGENKAKAEEDLAQAKKRGGP